MRLLFARVMAAAAFAAGAFAFVSPAAAYTSPGTPKFEALTATWGVTMPLTSGASVLAGRTGAPRSKIWW